MVEIFCILVVIGRCNCLCKSFGRKKLNQFADDLIFSCA